MLPFILPFVAPGIASMIGGAIAAGAVGAAIVKVTRLTISYLKNWLKKKKEELGKNELSAKITECQKKGDYNIVDCGLNKTNRIEVETENEKYCFEPDEISSDIYEGMMIYA